MDEAGDVTLLLNQLAGGDRAALSELVPRVYDQLRAIAHRQMAGEAQGHTLNATAVVHEAYMRLAELENIDWQNRAHFFAIAARAMRRVLVNHAISRNTKKRGGRSKRVELTEALYLDAPDVEAILTVNHALERLEALDERQVRVVECRFFGGMSVEDTALALGVSKATIKRDWAMARAWLNQQLSDG